MRERVQVDNMEDRMLVLKAHPNAHCRRAPLYIKQIWTEANFWVYYTKGNASYSLGFSATSRSEAWSNAAHFVKLNMIKMLSE